MRHGSLACALAALLSVGLLWPTPAEAQRRRAPRTQTVGRAVPAPRPVRARYPVYSHRYYYGGYSPYAWNWGLYWGWGSPWYPYYGYGYGYGYPWYSGWGSPYYGPYPYYYYDNYAAVRVQASPREAQVYVDGYFVGVVDDFDGTFQRLRVAPGGHEITLHLDGYRNLSQRIYLQPRTTFNLRARLEPLASGAPQDPVPAPNPDAVRSDEYGGRVEEPGENEPPPGPPSRRWPARQQAEQRQSQQAAEASRFGTLTLRVEPPDAEVTIDGTPWRGAADADGVLAIQLPAGTHRVEIGREGYVSYVADVNVRSNTATPLNVMLQK